jgi:hypothetical protein
VFAIAGSPGTDGLLKGGALQLEPDALDFDALAETIRAHPNHLSQETRPQAKLL